MTILHMPLFLVFDVHTGSTAHSGLVRKEYRGTALGVFNSLGQIAGAAGPLLGSLIVANYSFSVSPRVIFYTSILLSIPGVVVFAVFIKETLRKDEPKAL